MPKRSKTPKKQVETRTYAVKELVFGKMKGYPTWPGRVEELIPRSTGMTYRIFFFGSHNYGTLKSVELGPFDELKETLGKAKKPKTFVDAMKEANETPQMEAPEFNPNPPSEPEEETEEEDDDFVEPPKKKARVSISTPTTKKVVRKQKKAKLEYYESEEEKDEDSEDQPQVDSDGEQLPYLVSRIVPKKVKRRVVSDEDLAADPPKNRKQPPSSKKKTPLSVKVTTNTRNRKSASTPVRVSGLRKPIWKQKLDNKDKGEEEENDGSESGKSEDVKDLDDTGEVKNETDADDVTEDGEKSKNDDQDEEDDEEMSPEYSDLEDTPKKENVFNVSLLLERDELDSDVCDQLQEPSKTIDQDESIEKEKPSSPEKEVPIEDIVECVTNNTSIEEAKSFLSKEVKLVELMDALQDSISEDEIPIFKDVIECLTDLEAAPFDPIMIFKNTHFIETLLMTRVYFGPSNESLSKEQEEQCQIVRNKSQAILLTYLNAIKAPTCRKGLQTFLEKKMNKIQEKRQQVPFIALMHDPSEIDNLADC